MPTARPLTPIEMPSLVWMMWVTADIQPSLTAIIVWLSLLIAVKRLHNQHP